MYNNILFTHFIIKINLTINLKRTFRAIFTFLNSTGVPPCTIWARASKSNYYWLANHTYELTNEYTSRYGKIHKSTSMSQWFTKNAPSNLPNTICTDFAQAMPEQYKNADAVTAYRAYYLGEKTKFAKLKLGNVPEWFTLKDSSYKELVAF